jgi:hypothetical protein
MEIREYAEPIGRLAAELYRDKYGRLPRDVDVTVVGDWHNMAWTEAWIELVRHGATEEEYDFCLAAWRKGFWS